MKGNVSVKGRVKLTVRDSISGEIIEQQEGEIIEQQETDNLVVTNGYALLTGVLVGDLSISHIGVGSGNTVPDLNDSDLEIAIGTRKAITDTSRAGENALFSTFFSSADNNGTWREAVLATALSGDSTIISRALFDNTFTKNSSKTCTVDWIIIVSGG